jgi:phage I-like protein
MKLLFASMNLHSREPPKEFLLLPYGETQFRWLDGTEHSVTVTPDMAKAVIQRALEHKPKLPIDYNHASMVDPSVADPDRAKAAGWFALDLREDGLWMSDIEWTPQAESYIRNKEYNYFSPVWTGDESTDIIDLPNVALTNSPATLNSKPLMASLLAMQNQNEKGDDNMKLLMAAMGLKPEATEAEAVGLFNQVKAFLASAQGITGKQSEAEVLGVIQAWKASAEQVPGLQARLSTLEDTALKGEVETLLTQGETEGKISPALKASIQTSPEFEPMRKSPAMLKAFLASTAKIVDFKPENKTEQPKQETDTLSDEEKAVMTQMGVSREKFLASRQRLTPQA